MLVSLGTDEILVMTPGDVEGETVLQAIQQIPRERRRMIRTVDENGKLLARVREYLQPLREQAKDWPESAFVGFVEDPLYHLAVACKHKASVCDGGIDNAQEFLGIIDSSVFHGEARFRLSELAFLFTRYSPAYIEKMGVTGQVSDAAVREVLSKIIDSSEFEKVVASEGRLGYMKHPEVGLSKLKRAVIGLTSRKDFRSAVRAGVGVAELAPGLGPLSILKDVLPKAEGKHPFSPLFLDLPTSAHAAISRNALAEAYPGAVPSKGSIFLEEHIRGNAASHQWLNEGEEQKLVDNPEKDLAHRLKSAKNARGALMHIVEPSKFPDHRYSKPRIDIHRHRHS